MAEAFDYRTEPVYNQQGEQVDVARYRRRRGANWDTAEFRGTGEFTNAPGLVRRSVRGAAGRGAARNPVYTQYRAVNRRLRRGTNR